MRYCTQDAVWAPDSGGWLLELVALKARVRGREGSFACRCGLQSLQCKHCRSHVARERNTRRTNANLEPSASLTGLHALACVAPLQWRRYSPGGCVPPQKSRTGASSWASWASQGYLRAQVTCALILHVTNHMTGVPGFSSRTERESSSPCLASIRW